MADKLIVEFELEGAVNKNSQKKIEGQAKIYGGKAGDSYQNAFTSKAKSGIASIASSMKLLGAAALGLGLYKTFTAGIEAAQRQEDAINQLNSALQISGKYSIAASRELQEYASSLQSVTRYGDEAILETQALIQSLGNLSKGELKDATKTTLDLAAALKIDLKSAATLVGKAAAGEVGSFSRYGVSIKKASTNSETLKNALKALNKSFGGAAEKDVLTYSGANEQLSNSFGDVLEGVGKFVTENPLVIAATTAAKKGFSSLAKTINEAADSFNNIFKDESELSSLQNYTNQIDEARAKLDSYKNATKEGGADQFTTQGEIFKKQIPILEKLIVGLERRKKLIEETNKSETSGEDESAEKEVINKTQLAEKLKAIGVGRIAQLQQEQVDKQLVLDQGLETELLSEQEYLNRKLFLQQDYTAKIAAEEEKRAVTAAGFFETMRLESENFTNNEKSNQQQLAKSLKTLAVNGYGTAFKNIGAALASGENAQNAFADAAKNAVADAASAVGDYYILDGVGRIAKSYGADATGYQMLAAGTAMKVLSGALGAGSSTPSGSSSSESSSGTFTGDNETALSEQDVEERQTGTIINLEVGGSLVQQEELGAYISTVMSESNQKNSNVILEQRIA